jgi:hypothetical protein
MMFNEFLMDVEEKERKTSTESIYISKYFYSSATLKFRVDTATATSKIREWGTRTLKQCKRVI